MKVAENNSERKVELAHWLLELDDENIHLQIEELKKISAGDWYAN